MYNAISVVIFHFSWKYQSSVWAIRGQAYLNSGSLENTGVTINGWLRYFLWSQSSQVIDLPLLLGLDTYRTLYGLELNVVSRSLRMGLQLNVSILRPGLLARTNRIDSMVS